MIPKRRTYTPKNTRGFTLIEMITVIIVLGVVSVGISGFIRTGVGIYSDVTERDQLLGDSRFLVERLNRELRTAIPNSIREASNSANNIRCIEFVKAEWVTFYTNLSVEPDTTNTATIVEIDGNAAGYTIAVGDFAIVYPTSDEDVYDLVNSDGNSDRNKRKRITACTDTDGDCYANADPNNTAILTVEGLLSGDSDAFADNSPASRLYIARNATSYCLHSTEKSIYRYESSITEEQEDNPDTDDGVLMAENVVNNLSDTNEQPFTVIPASLTRNGLVQILLTFEREEELINFSNEVHIPNVP